MSARTTHERDWARLLAASTTLLCASFAFGGAVASAATSASPAATLRDPANDVRAGDVDLTAISVGKLGGALVVRFTVRTPITDGVSYTANVKAGGGSWALVARRGDGADSFLLYNLSTGSTTPVTGAIRRPHGDGHGSDRPARRADGRDARSRQRLLPGRADRRPEWQRRPRRDDRADGVLLPHGSEAEAEVGSVHLAGPGSVSGPNPEIEWPGGISAVVEMG